MRTKIRKNKGLRYFSIKVIEHVQTVASTTYQDLANLLVNEYFRDNPPKKPGAEHDDKNIRRRIYGTS